MAHVIGTPIQIEAPSPYTSHPQGKSYVNGDDLVVDYKIGLEHVGTDTSFVRRTVSLTDMSIGVQEVVAAPDYFPELSPGLFGRYSVAGGTDGTYEYYQVYHFQRADTGDYGYQIYYRLLGAENWTIVPWIPKRGIYDTESHSFCVGRNGIIVFSYQDFWGGELGFATTDDLFQTYTEYVYDDTLTGGAIERAEPSIKYDATTDKYFGFTRSQSAGLLPQFWVSSDLITYSKYNMVAPETFYHQYVMYPLVVAEDRRIYSVCVERAASTTSQGIFLLSADIDDAIVNGWDAFSMERIDTITSNNLTSIGTGASSLAYDNGVLYYAYGLETVKNTVAVMLNTIALSTFEGKIITSIDGTDTLVHAIYDNKIFSQDGINYYRGVKDGASVSVAEIGLTSY